MWHKSSHLSSPAINCSGEALRIFAPEGSATMRKEICALSDPYFDFLPGKCPSPITPQGRIVSRSCMSASMSWRPRRLGVDWSRAVRPARWREGLISWRIWRRWMACSGSESSSRPGFSRPARKPSMAAKSGAQLIHCGNGFSFSPSLGCGQVSKCCHS